MTSAQLPLPILAALGQIEHSMQLACEFGANNESQEGLLRVMDAMRVQISLPELEAFASRRADEINSHLAQAGHPEIHLEPFTDPMDFGIAAILKVLVEWVTEGIRCEISGRHGGTYPGVSMERGENVFLFKPIGADTPMVCLRTKSGDLVYLAMTDEMPNLFHREGTRLPRMSDTHYTDGTYTSVHFPMIDVDLMVDVDWLNNLVIVPERGPSGQIAQASMRLRFKMNTKGASADAAFAAQAAFECCRHKHPLVFDRPFLLWIDRPSFPKIPLVVIHVTPESWKDPGEL